MYVYIVSLLVGNVTWCTWNTGNTCCGVCYSIHIFVWNLSNLATLFAHYVIKMYNTFIVSVDISVMKEKLLSVNHMAAGSRSS